MVFFLPNCIVSVCMRMLYYICIVCFSLSFFKCHFIVFLHHGQGTAGENQLSA